MKISRARAPLRVSFGGGGSDVPPYVTLYGGAVLSATIDRYAYASVRSMPEVLRVESLDYGCQSSCLADKEVIFDGQLDLAMHVMELYREHIKVETDSGLEAVLHNDAPPGSGLGSSSAITVALIAAISEHLRLPVDYYELADEAWTVERCLARISGGFQDQYACTFGGFNFIEIPTSGEVVVNPLRVRPSTLCELEYRSVFAHVGGSHFSSHIIDKQAGNIEKEDKRSLDATTALREIAHDMKNSLLTDKISHLGGLLHEAWGFKKRMAEGITNDRIDELYELARGAGALGGKVTGAGGGGFMYFICEPEKRFAVQEVLEKAGAEPGRFAFTHEGVRSWRA